MQFEVTSLLTEERKRQTKLRDGPNDRRNVARFMTARPALGPTQAAIQESRVLLRLGIAAGLEANLSRPYSAEF